jgi:hypothetical protein
VSVDLRSLAAMRMGIGLLVMWDQWFALQSATLFYSDDGVLPRALITELGAQPSEVWSLHAFSGGTAWQVALLVLGLIVGGMVVSGFRTRLVVPLAWLLTCSLQGRNPFVLYGGDVVLRMLLFWGMLLPLGKCWSLDARGGAPLERLRVFGVAPLCLLLQVAMIYWFTGVLKSGNEWSRDGSAVYHVLMADQFVLTPGLWLLPYPSVCEWLSYGVLWLEAYGPFLVFIPWRTAWWRMAAIVTFMGLHIGLGLCLRIGYFSTVMMVCWLAFIPSAVWDWWLGRGTDRLLSSISAAWLDAVAGCCMCIVLIWNFWTVDPVGMTSWKPDWLTKLGYRLRVDQHWCLFAPSPVTDDGWSVLEATTTTGEKIDLLRAGRGLSFAKPPMISLEYPDWKWHKFQVNLLIPANAAMRTNFARYLIDEHNRRSDIQRQVNEWQLWFIRETTLPNYMAIEPQKILLAEGAEGGL